MIAPTDRADSVGSAPATRGYSGALGGLSYFLLGLASLGISYVVLRQIGMQGYVAAIAGVVIGSLFAIVSFRRLMVPFVIWLAAIGGFKFLWSIRTPLLPDLFMDRIAMLWLGMVFLIKVVATKRELRGPFLLDILLASHAFYIFVRVMLQGGEFLNPWIASLLMPYSAYFLAKNIITDMKRLRVLLWILVALAVYYSVTMIAEKYSLEALVFPKSIITERDNSFRGRSIGPFLQPGVSGTTLGMMLPIFLYFVATVRVKLARVMMLAGLLTGLAGLYFTYTRGSWLAGAMAIGAAAVLNRRRYMTVLLPALVLAPIVAVSFIGVGDDQFVQERFEDEDTLGSRVGTAVTVLKVWRDNPILGVGFFQYRYARDSYIDPITVPGLGTIRFIQFRHNNIHDIYLGPLAEDGLVGAALQFAIYFLIFRTFWRKYKWRKEGNHFAQYILPVFGGLYVGYLVGGLAIDYRFFSTMGTLFYMSAGIQEGMLKSESDHVS